jgi:exodeoxyribonuclease-5
MMSHSNIKKFSSKYPNHFSDDQKKALAFLESFIKDKSKSIATLYGAAGVGKTYTLKYFIDEICRYSVCPTAPTHKAVRVIESITGKQGKTFHSLHGLRPNTNIENFDISNPNFDPMADPKIKHYAVVIVDEASQINNDLHHLNVTRANQYGVKILYVGDILQLPPIGQNISEVFSIPDKYELTTIMRQEKGNPILELAALLRYDIQHGTENGLKYIFKHGTRINENGEGYELLTIKDFASRSVEYFSADTFLSDIDHVRFLAFTNDSVNKWNTYVRNETIGDIAKNEIVHHDDLFTGYNTVLNEFNEPAFVNSEDYVVHSVEKRINDDGINVFVVVLKNVHGGNLTPELVIVDHTNETFKRFYNTLSNLHYDARYAPARDRRVKWRQYYDYKNKHLVLIDFELKSGGFVKKDLSYGFGLTVHKSQGSTYDNVFINLLNIAFYNGDRTKPRINTRKNPKAVEFKNRLLYVALTRAKKKAILLI